MHKPPRQLAVLKGIIIMHIEKVLLLFFVALVLPSPVWGSGDDELTTVPEILAAMERVYGSADALQADFVQVTRSAALGDEQRQKGKVVMQRPRKMRWDFVSPETKLFVTDGETMWIWSPADNQVIVYRDVSDNSSDVVTLLTDLNRLQDIFDVTLLDNESDKNAYVLDLQPREQGNMKSLLLFLSRKKLLPERVILTDQFDTVTDLSFSQVKLDPKVSDVDFTFAIPDGAEVITPEGL